MSDFEIEPLDGWMKAPTERFEDELYVHEEVYGEYRGCDVEHAGISKQYIAIYDEGDHFTVEHYNDGDYNFHQPETLAELQHCVNSCMEVEQ